MLPNNLSELSRVRDECRSMVKQRALASAGAAAVPIPGTDIAADVGLLLELIPAINRKFGLSPEQIDSLDSTIKPIILKIITTIGSKLVGQLITKELILQVLKKIGVRMAAKQVTKYIPFVGQISAALISYNAMLLVGNSHVDDCYKVIKEYLKEREFSII